MRKGALISLTIFSLFLAILVAQKINLTTADLGRHIKNGEIMLHPDQGRTLSTDSQSPTLRNRLLNTNFYSYTEPSTPFVNHHWGSGVLFYLIFSIFGWAGLSLFHILIFVSAFALMFLLSSKRLSILYLLPLALFLLPLIGDRTEVRPETISMLFIAIFIYLLIRFSERKIKKKFLYIIPIITLLWANIHIYFVFGIFIIGAFLLERIIRRDWNMAKSLAITLGLSVIASAITPFGPEALIYPFTIFGNYGYKLVENQSISFLENINFINPSFLWWKISAVLAVLATVWALWKRPRQFPIALGLIALTFGVLSFLAIRNFSIFGLVLLPYLAGVMSLAGNELGKPSRNATAREPGRFSAENTSVVFPNISEQTQDLVIAGSILVSIILLIIIPIRFSSRIPGNPSWGLGLMPGVNNSAQFVEDNKISGPIFSNYDIGGYLIFHEFPKEKVFVDNRPEAYSEEFFKNIYVPMQEKEDVWQKELAHYNFNTIWFYRHDFTPWAQRFLIARVQDPTWAPVYVDNYVIIFLRRTPTNSELIKQYELPKSMFQVN